MHEVILQTGDFAVEYAIREVKTILGKDCEQVDADLLLVEFKDDSELIKGVYDLLFYSRLFSNIFLIAGEDFEGEVDTLEISGEEVDVFDLVGFDLDKKDYFVNEQGDDLNPIFVNYCFYLMGLDKEKGPLSIVNYGAGFGDMIIEASLFNPRKAIFVKKKNGLSMNSFFKGMGKVPMPENDKNKYTAIVLDNLTFKKLKENITYSGQKIRISQFDLDWLDVKYHKSDFDYCLSFFPEFESSEEKGEFESQFFYQAEFITGKKILVVSYEPIGEEHLENNKLSLEHYEEVEFDEDLVYHVYVIKSNK